MAIRETEDPLKLANAFPSNSYATRDSKKEETRKDIRKVTNGKVRKQGLIRRIGRSIIEDSIETARDKAINDIAVPGFKSLIFDTLTEILEVMLFGRDGAPVVNTRRYYDNSRRSEQTSYSKFYDNRDRRDRKSRYSEVSMVPDDIIVDSRQEARAALNELDFIIHKYGQASIADFYDIVGVTSDWTDNRYGWLSLRDAKIKPVRDGFMILLPPTEVLSDD